MNVAEGLVPRISQHHGLAPGPVFPPAWPGVMNDVCVVGSGDDRYVVRARAGVFAVEEFEREQWCAEAARAVDVPTPLILFSGIEAGAAYSVQRFVPGVSGEGRRSPELWKFLGECARKIATTSLAGAPSELFSRFGRDLPAAWSAHIAYNLAELTPSDPLIDLGVYELADLSWMRSVIGSLSALRLDHGLVHGDLALRNLIVSEEKSPVLIDWGAASAGPVPHTDLINLLRNRDQQENPDDHEIDAFLQGFGVDPAVVLPQAHLLALLHALDVVRWAIEQAPDRIPGTVDHARRLVAVRAGPKILKS